MMAPHFFLVVILLSADSFFTPNFDTVPKPYFDQALEIDPMVTHKKDILLGSILSQHNLAVAIPIYDEDFDKKLNGAVLTLGKEDEVSIDSGFDADDEYYDTSCEEEFLVTATEYSTEVDEGFGLDTTLTTDVTPPLSN